MNSLFSPSLKTFTYNLPLIKARARMEAIFNQPRQLFQGPDFTAHFTGGETFEMEIIPVGASITRFRSVLYGTLQQTSKNQTIVQIKTKPAVVFKILFWIMIIMGIIYLAKSIYNNKFILPGLATIILGPLITVKIAGINNVMIEERYKSFVHKAMLQ